MKRIIGVIIILAAVPLAAPSWAGEIEDCYNEIRREADNQNLGKKICNLVPDREYGCWIGDSRDFQGVSEVVNVALSCFSKVSNFTYSDAGPMDHVYEGRVYRCGVSNAAWYTDARLNQMHFICSRKN